MNAPGINLWIAVLGWTLLHFTWQGAIVAAWLAAGLRLLRHHPATLRHAVACTALALLALAPVWTLHRLAPPPGFGRVATPLVPAVRAEIPRPATELTDPAPPRLLNLNPRGTTTPPPASPVARLLPWVVGAWAAGVLLMAGRLAAGWRLVRRAARAAGAPLPAPWPDRLRDLAGRLGVHRPVRLICSALVEVPATLGWWQPVILLPAACLAGLSPDQLAAVLAHELAHIRRHDYLVNFLQCAVETLLFHHPAVWWVSRKVRETREFCCDDLAVAACGNRAVYVRALATLEELRPGAPLVLAAAGAPLLARIRRLVRPAPFPHPGPAVPAWVLGLSLLAAGWVAAALPGGTGAADPGGKTPQRGASPGRKALLAKLDAIPVDYARCEQMPLREVVAQLRELSRARDAEHQGVNFALYRLPLPGVVEVDPNTGAVLPGEPADVPEAGAVLITIRPELRGLRLHDLLEVIVHSASAPLRYTVEDYAVGFYLAAEPAGMATRFFRVDPNTFRQGLESVGGIPFAAAAVGNSSAGGGGGAGGGGAGNFLIPQVQAASGGTGGAAAAGGGGAVGGGAATTGGIGNVTRPAGGTNTQALVRQFFSANGIDFNTAIPGGPTRLVFLDESGTTLMVHTPAEELPRVAATLRGLGPTNPPAAAAPAAPAVGTNAPSPNTKPKPDGARLPTGPVLLAQAGPPGTGVGSLSGTGPKGAVWDTPIAKVYRVEVRPWLEELQRRMPEAPLPAAEPARREWLRVAVDRQLDEWGVNTAGRRAMFTETNGTLFLRAPAGMHPLVAAFVERLNAPPDSPVHADPYLPVLPGRATARDLDLASREALHRQADVVELRQELAAARQAESHQDFPAAVRAYEAAQRLVNRLGVGAENQAGPVREGLTGALFELARGLQQKQDYAGADARLRRLLVLAPEHTAARALLAANQRFLGVAAEPAAENATPAPLVGTNVLHAAALVEDAKRLLGAGQWAAAGRELEAALRADPASETAADYLRLVRRRVPAADPAPPPATLAPTGPTPPPPAPVEPLVTRTFHVDTRRFLAGLSQATGLPVQNNPTEPSGAREVQAALRAFGRRLGCAWPEPDPAATAGATNDGGPVLLFNPAKGVLFVRAAKTDVEVLAQAMEALLYLPPQIQLQLRVAEFDPARVSPARLAQVLAAAGAVFRTNETKSVPLPKFPGLTNLFHAPERPLTNAVESQFLGELSPAQSRRLSNELGKLPGVTWWQGPGVVTENQREAWLQKLDALTIVTDVAAGTNGSAVNYLTEAQHVGLVLAFQAAVAADDHRLHLTGTSSLTEFVGYDDPGRPANDTPRGAIRPLPRFRVSQLDFDVPALRDGHTLLLGGLESTGPTAPPDHAKPSRSGPARPAGPRRPWLLFVTPTLINPDGSRYHPTETK